MTAAWLSAPMAIVAIGTIENVVAALLAVLSFTLFVIAVISFLRSRNSRIAMISVAFLLFFSEGILFTYQLFYQQFTPEAFYSVIGLVNVVILLFIFAATFKR